eukprot:209132_1
MSSTLYELLFGSVLFYYGAITNINLMLENYHNKNTSSCMFLVVVLCISMMYQIYTMKTTNVSIVLWPLWPIWLVYQYVEAPAVDVVAIFDAIGTAAFYVEGPALEALEAYLISQDLFATSGKSSGSISLWLILAATATYFEFSESAFSRVDQTQLDERMSIIDVRGNANDKEIDSSSSEKP